MITQLAKLGATQRITVVLDYTEAGVTASILFKPKTQEGGTPIPSAVPAVNPIQLSGTVAEVEAYLNDGFYAATARIEGLMNNVAEVEAALKKAAEDKKPEPVEPAKKTTPIAQATPVPELKPAWKKAEAPAPAPATDEPADDELAAMFEEGT